MSFQLQIVEAVSVLVTHRVFPTLHGVTLIRLGMAIVYLEITSRPPTEFHDENTGHDRVGLINYEHAYYYYIYIYIYIEAGHEFAYMLHTSVCELSARDLRAYLVSSRPSHIRPSHIRPLAYPTFRIKRK